MDTQKKWEKYYKDIKEGYSYTRNQPKNVDKIVLSPVENYDYGYSYALYKPEKHWKTVPPEVEKKWQGIL